MNTKRRFLSCLLIVMLLLGSMLGLASCDSDKPEEEYTWFDSITHGMADAAINLVDTVKGWFGIEDEPEEEPKDDPEEKPEEPEEKPEEKPEEPEEKPDDPVEPPHTHVWSDWESDETSHWHTCTCGERESAAHVSSGPATSEAAEICTVCQRVLAPQLSSHTHETVHVAKVDATCTAGGNIEYWYCEGCDQYFKDEACTTLTYEELIAIPALAHAGMVHKDAKDPTCTAEGNVEYWYCALCETYFANAAATEVITDVIVPENGHSYDMTEWVQGSAGHWHECTECGAKTDFAAHASSSPATEDREEICDDCGYVMAGKLSHTHTPIYYAAEAATCVKEGSLEHWYCTGCNQLFADEALTTRTTEAELTVAKTEHSWLDVETVDATCQVAGYKVRECQAGGCTAKETYDRTEMLKCNEEQTDYLAPTCDTEGYTELTCTMCATSRRITLGKVGHSYEATVVDPTCTAQGYTSYACSKCNDAYIDEDSYTEKLPHSYEEETVGATCTAPGSVSYVCSVCGHLEAEPTVIPANGHSWTEATCTAGAACEVCGATGAPALPHVFDAENNTVSVDKVATCTEKGEITVKCSNCDTTSTLTTDMTGHTASDWSDYVTVATCTKERKIVCTVCDTTISSETITEHNDENLKSTIQPATCSTTGSITTSCGDCGTLLSTETVEVSENAHAWDTSSSAALLDGTNATVQTCTLCNTTKTVYVDDGSGSLALNSGALAENTDLQLGGGVSLTTGNGLTESLGNKTGLSISAGIADNVAAPEGSDVVYDLTLSDDEGAISELGGEMTVRLPYTLDEGEDPKAIIVSYIKEDGSVEKIGDRMNENDEYDESDAVTYLVVDGQGYVEFKTTHFSYYTVTRLTPKERCGIYGHIYETTIVPATCLTKGYTVDVCKRCRDRQVYDDVDALGHKWQYDMKAATCTENGYEKGICERCQIGYELVINKLGHSWMLDEENSKAPTCASEGFEHYVCSADGCDATYDKTVAKTAHRYTTTNIPASCTTGGYTEAKCAACGYTTKYGETPAKGHRIEDEKHEATCKDRGYTSHKCKDCDVKFADTDFEDKKDHEWNFDEPTCDQDSCCKHCGSRNENSKNNGKAYGHEMINGHCKHCGVNCDHNWSKKPIKTVEATCAARGYELYQCHKCYATKEANYTDKLDHEFHNGICENCGQAAEMPENLYYNMLTCWGDIDGVVIKIEDLKILTKDLYDVNGETVYGEPTGVEQYEILEVLLKVDENGELYGIAYGKAKLWNVDGDGTSVVCDAKAVIKDGYVYAIVSDTVGDVQESGGEIYFTYSLDTFIESMKEDMFDSAEMADELLLWAEDNLVPLLNGFANSNTSGINSILESLVEMFFEVDVDKYGYTFTLSSEKLHALNENLATLTVSELVSYYFGEEAYQNVTEFAKMAFGIMIPELLDFAEIIGIDSEALVVAINTLAALSGAPEGFDIKAMLEDQQFEGITVGMLVFETETTAEALEQLEAMLGAVAGMNVYKDMMGLEEEAIENVKTTVDAVIDELLSYVELGFSAAINGDVTEIIIGVNEFSMNSGDMVVDVNGNITVVPDGSVDDDFVDELITKVEGSYTVPELEDEVDTNSDGWNNWTDYYEYNGNVYMAEVYYLNIYNYTYRYSNAVGAGIFRDCGAWNEVTLFCERERGEGSFEILSLMSRETKEQELMVIRNQRTDDTVEITMTADGFVCTLPDGTVKAIDVSKYEEINNQREMYTTLVLDVFGSDVLDTSVGTTSVDFYYNTVTGEVDMDGETHHNYVLNSNKSVAALDCYTPGYDYYECADCGSAVVVATDAHELVTKAELMEGSQSCKDGVILREVCTKCGLVTDERHNYYHAYISEYTYVDGIVYCRERCLVCGESSSEYSVLGFESEDATLEFVEGGDVRVHYFGSQSAFLGQMDYNYCEAEFKFTPSVSGTYQFYNTGFGYTRIYITDGKNILATYQNEYYNMGGGTGENGGSVDLPIVKPDVDGDYVVEYAYVLGGYEPVKLEYDFTAGETYYIYLSLDGTLVADLKETKTENLADYGCVCGGTMTVTSNFGDALVEINANCTLEESADGYVYCTTCGFAYAENAGYVYNEFCEQVYERVVYFTNLNLGGEFEYVAISYKTGRVNHKMDYTSDYNSTQGVDKYGNAVTIYTEESREYCMNCNETIYSYKRVWHNDSKGNRTYYLDEVYNYDYTAGELKIAEKTEREWFYVLGQYRELYTAKYNYNTDGSVSWSRTDYSYNINNICQVTTTVTDSNGYYSSTTVFNHRETVKRVEDECSRVTDVNGNIVDTNVYEYYCDICYASIDKYANVYTYDQNGNMLKHTRIEYVQFANDDTDYGYRIDYTYTYEYGLYECEFGSTIYTKSYLHEDYDEDGSVYNAYGWKHEYISDDSCEYIPYSYQNGEWVDGGFTDVDHRYIYQDYRLADGATSCEDGLDVYSVCACCGYEYYDYNTWSHQFNDIDRVTVDATTLGATCPGTITYTYCPCGDRFVVDIALGCDMGYHYDGKYACAVTDPACGFSYTYTSGWENDDQCREWYYERYVFGEGDNALVIEERYLTGGVYHNTESKNLDYTTSITDPETGITYEARVTGHEYSCTVCQIKTERYENVQYYLDGERKGNSSAWYYYRDNGELSSYDMTAYMRIYDAIGDSHDITSFHFNKSYNYYYGDEGYYDKETGEYIPGDGTPKLEEWWSKTTYTYPVCYGQAHVVSTNSDGYRNEYDQEHSTGNHYAWIVEPTCTQPGVERTVCYYCGETRDRDVEPMGHYYEGYMENDSYVERCYRCNLQNFTGYDGRVVMEDLTVRLGDGTNYVIGYYMWDHYKEPEYDLEEFMVYLLLICEDGSEIDLYEFLSEDAVSMGNGIITVNIALLSEAISAYNDAYGTSISLCEDMLRVALVPVNDSSFDYAVTLDPHVWEYETTYSTVGIFGNHTKTCVLCGATESAICDTYSHLSGYNSWHGYYYGQPMHGSYIEGGTYYYVQEYVCRWCKEMHRQVTYRVYTDTCTYDEYRYLEYGKTDDGLYANKTTAVKSGSGSSHHYTYVIDAVFNSDYNFGSHSRVCDKCGDTNVEGCWQSSYHGEEIRVIDGKEYMVELYTCACGRKIERYYFERVAGCLTERVLRHMVYDTENNIVNEWDSVEERYGDHASILCNHAFNEEYNNFYCAGHTCEACGETVYYYYECGFNYEGGYYKTFGSESESDASAKVEEKWVETYRCWCCNFYYETYHYSDDAGNGYRVYLYNFQYNADGSETYETKTVLEYKACAHVYTYSFAYFDGVSTGWHNMNCENCEIASQGCCFVHEDLGSVGTFTLDDGTVCEVYAYNCACGANFQYYDYTVQSGDYKTVYRNYTLLDPYGSYHYFEQIVDEYYSPEGGEVNPPEHVCTYSEAIIDNWYAGFWHTYRCVECGSSYSEPCQCEVIAEGIDREINGVTYTGAALACVNCGNYYEEYTVNSSATGSILYILWNFKEDGSYELIEYDGGYTEGSDGTNDGVEVPDTGDGTTDGSESGEVEVPVIDYTGDNTYTKDDNWVTVA